MILHGRPFSPTQDQVPVAFFRFGPNGNRTQSYAYNITWNGDDHNIWQFIRVESNISITPQVQSYRFDNHAFTATCDTPLNAITSLPCIEGFYQDEYLDITVNNTRNKTVAHFKAIDKVWANTPADDAPSFILEDKNTNTTRLRTAVTMKGDCTQLKLCLAGGNDVADLLPAVGLALFHQDEYSQICTTPNSN